LIIAIDGPSGAGKSTLAKRLAKELGFIYVDTGAMYRALALKVLREGVDLADDASMARLIGSTTIDLRQVEGALQVLLDGADVAAEIRTPQVSQMASKASALGDVRARLLELQRDMARRGSIVAEGRDIGTVVFPAAAVKFFLDAAPEERAERRLAEEREHNPAATYEQTLVDITERDRRDTTRIDSPLVAAEDAIVIDSTGQPVEEVFQRMIIIVRESRGT